MYGMIHNGMREMVIDRLGEDEWRVIEGMINIGPPEMIGMTVYDDALTFCILGAIAGRLGQSVPECLRGFGRYWVSYAERGSFRSIMQFTGSTIESFIGNLDRMHRAVAAAMPEASLPSFRVIEAQPGRLLVQYQSKRSGLEPFVCGLFEGLLARFELVGEVRLYTSGNGYAEFEIRHRTACAT